MKLNLKVFCFAYLLFALTALCIINFNSQAQEELVHRGDLIVVNSTYVIAGVYYKQDGNIIIENSTLIIKNATLEILQDSEHRYYFEANNSNLILEYAQLTVATKQLMPYLRLNFTIKNTNFTLSHSTISFPGRMSVIDSKVEILVSLITKLGSLPEGVDADENDDAPVISCINSNISIKNSVLEDYTQIYFCSSNVFIANSEFKNFHETQETTHKFITPLKELETPDDYMIIVQPNKDFEITNFRALKEPDLTKILDIQLEARIGGEFDYNASDCLQYSLDSDYRNTTITFSKGFTDQTFNLRREGVRSLEDLERIKLLVRNTDPENDSNSEIVIDYIAIVVTYDTDILLENTNFYTVNSYLDLDLRLGASLVEGISQPLNRTNYLFNYEPSHNRLKALNKSFVWLCSVTVDLTETGGTAPSLGNPPFVGDASSQIFLSRWVKIRTADRVGVALGNVSIEIIYEINNTTVHAPPKIILDYLGKNFTNWNLTNVDGELLVPLCSDILTPESWPNSEFIGNYRVVAYYKNKNLTTFTSLSLAQFPELTENSNLKELKIEFAELLLPPTSMEAELTISNTSCNPGEKITISGVVRYNNNLPVADALVEVSIHGKIFSTLTLQDGSYNIELTVPTTAQSYIIQIVISERVYNLTPYIATRELIVVAPPPAPNIMLPIVIMVVVVICFSTLLLRNRLKLWFYVARARIKKEKFIECSECGYLIPISAKKCPKCRATFEEEVAKCSECGAIIPITAEKCPICGASFEERR